MFGFKKHEIIGNKYFDFIPEEERIKLIERNNRRLAGEDIESIYETKIIEKSGNIATVEVNVNLIQYNGAPASIGSIRNITERKRIEEELRANQQQLKYVFDSMSDGFWDWNVATNHVTFNDNYFSMAGYDRNDIDDFQSFFWKCLHPEDHAQVHEKIKEIISGNINTYSAQFRLKKKNNEWMWILSRGNIVQFDAEGNPLRFVGTHTDITEFIELRKNKEESYRFLETLLETIPIPVFYKNTDGIYLGGNKAFLEIIGVSKDKFVGASVFDLYEERLANIYYNADNKLFVKKGIQIYDAQIRHADTSLRDVTFYKSVYYDLDNNPAGLIGAMIDVTDRNKFIAEINEKKRFLESILSNIPVVLFSINKNKVFTLSEGKGLAKLGLKPGQAVGLTIYDLYGNNNQIISSIERALEGKLLYDCGPYGDTFFEIYFTPIYSEENTVDNIIGIAMDVTERKKAEAEVKEYISQLNKSKENIEKYAFELEKSQEALQKLNYTKDVFFSIISHDLRSPFNSLLGFSDLLINDLSQKKDNSAKGLALSLQKSLKNVYSLLENLLEWSRIQIGGIENNHEVFNLYNLLMETINLMNLNISQKKIILNNSVANNIMVNADKYMISTVLRNILSNAIKFTPENGVIELESEISEKECLLVIKDSGIGMSQQQIEELFKIEHVKASRGTEGEYGTGLGLILCQELLNKNKGKLYVNSKEGKGSEFTISLPSHR